jgi:F-type H+-transporting ATPase subunit alpha
MGKHVIVDQNGVVTASSSETNTDSSRPIFVPIPKISEIGLIDTPLVTGITAIDALTPIGKGQNMLIIGTQEKELGGVISMDKSNKRAWMINLLKSVVEKDRADRAKKDGPSNNLRCFYGLTAADSAARTNFMKRLENAGIKEDIVTVVSTQSNDCAADSMTKTLEAAEAVAVAATAATLAEHHALTTGGDALVIVDDINLHKSLWDITTQQLVEIYGVDAVVKADLQGGSSSEMRGYFSGLIQRAARFKSSKGGGSVTLILLSTLPSDDEVNSGSAKNDEDSLVFDPSEFESMSEKIQTRIATLVKAKVPLTATNLKKVQIPLPRPSESEDTKRLALQHVEDLISMSDGQIWFDDELAKMGRSPPLDPSRSIVSQCLPYVCVFFLLETSCTHIAYR